MKVGSLCTGIGGLDLAVETHFGAETIWCAEWEEHLDPLIQRHFGPIRNLRDLTSIDWKEMDRMAARRNDELAQAMYDRYCQGLSVQAVAEEFGRTRQTVWKMFERRGWDLRQRPPARPSVEWRGRSFSLRDGGYYAATDGDREYLHRLIWEHTNGPLPAGHEVHHKDHDKTNNDPSNLVAMTKADHARLHGNGGVMPNEEPAVDVLTAGYP